jgi:hypothetical protein
MAPMVLTFLLALGILVPVAAVLLSSDRARSWVR